MATQIQLSPPQINDFKAVGDLSADTLASVTRHLNSLASPPLKPSELLAAIEDALGEERQAAEIVMRQALSLNALMRQTGMGVDSILGGIQFGIHREADWSPEELSKWENIEPSLRELLCTDAFRLVATAIDLSYEYANLFRKAKILTDIRPLFTADAEKIEGAVVSYTLRLRFDSIDGGHELSIAMDEGDVRALLAESERALKKAQTARRTVIEKVEVPTFVTGESDNA